MGQEIKKTCDRCGKTEVIKKTILSEVGDEDILEVPILLKILNKKDRRRYDLCYRCRRLLELKLNDFIDEGPDPTDRKAPIRVPAKPAGIPVRKGGLTGYDP